MPFIPTGPTNYSQESGGNLASIKTDSDTIATNTGAISTASGTVADTTYTTGSGSVISLLKGIFGNLSSTLGISGSVSVSNFPSTQPVSGTVTANAGSGTLAVSLATNTPTLQSGSTTAVTQATGTNLHTVVDSGTITAVTAITNALPAGTNLMGKVGIDQTTPGATNAVANTAIGVTTLPTGVAQGSQIEVAVDRHGRGFGLLPTMSTASSAGTAITTNTNTQLVGAPGASTHLRPYRFWAQNSGAAATWCYLGNGSGVKTLPFYLGTGQPFSIALNGEFELSTNTALYLNTATTGANIEWFVAYESLAD
jgi:hypothetical protein